MKVLVTGKNGQLGSEFQSISKQFSQFNFTFTGSNDLDITSAEAVKVFFKQNSFDVVINCAAYTAVDKAEDEPEKADDVNHLGVKYIVENCERKNIKLIHISTDYVFDGTNRLPYKESDPISPIGIYGKTKQLGEQAIQNSSLDAIIIRTSWVYSTFGNNFVKTMLRLGEEKNEINVVNDQFGTPTYAKDLAVTCLSILNQINSWESGVSIYNYSNEGVISWFDFATEIMKLGSLDCKVNPISTDQFPTRAKRPKFSVLDKAKIKNTFNIEVPYWRDSLMECLKNK